MWRFLCFEIAICFNALCFDGVTKNLSFNVTKAKNFIDSYNSIRKLNDDEKKNIKVLSQGAALRFLLTRVFDALNTVDGAIVKIKDPIESYFGTVSDISSFLATDRFFGQIRKKFEFL